MLRATQERSEGAVSEHTVRAETALAREASARGARLLSVGDKRTDTQSREGKAEVRQPAAVGEPIESAAPVG